jgi:hypothetical protein
VRAADEDSLLVLADHLPAEAAEALLELATGGRPKEPVPDREPAATYMAAEDSPAKGAKPSDPFDHPDAQRRFRMIATSEELQQALEFPWERWTVFLHPDQRDLVMRDYNGPTRVAGSAGTGKTVVALHRATHLARANPDGRVLLATFSDALASALHTMLQRLLVGEPRLAERIEVCSLDAIGLRLHKALLGPVELVDRQVLRAIIKAAAEAVPAHKFSQQFLVAEWDQVVDAGSFRTGTAIAMWPASAGRRGSPSHSEKRFGRSLSRCAPNWPGVD